MFASRKALLSVVLLAFGMSAFAAPPQRPLLLDIAPQPLADSLSELARAANLQLIFYSSVGKGVMAPRVSGQLTPQVAFDQMLAGTGLRYEYLDSQTVAILGPDSAAMIAPSSGVESAVAGAESVEATLRLARQDAGEAKGDQTGAQAGKPASEDVADSRSQEIIVTGTSIRGVIPASPVSSYSRAEIDRTGAATIQQFIQQLPQNFGGGASESTLLSLSGGNGVDSTFGTGANLRGLGNDSTLLLINGRRVAASGVSGNFVDISMIPLSAVERIDVVTDGASSTYGSDAIGGVVNIILKEEFDGAQTRLRYGSITGGDSSEINASQSLGHDWGRGSAVLGYDFYDRKSLDVADRRYTEDLESPFTILPKQRRHSTFVAARQAVGDSFTVFGDAAYSQRRAFFDAASTGGLRNRYTSKSKAYNADAGIEGQWGERAGFLLAGTFGHADTFQQAGQPEPPNYFFDADSDLISLDARIDGDLPQIASRTVRYAVGAQYRQEEFAQVFQYPAVNLSQDYSKDRAIEALFAELNIPLLTDGQDAERLGLSLASRAERYDDFGDTNNPKVGLTWHINPQLKLRGTYGTSFKAPRLNDLNSLPAQVVPFPIFDPTTGTETNAMVIFGGSADLQPEESTSWTVGIDFARPDRTGLRFSLTYYSVDFEERITDPQFIVDLTDAFRREAELGPDIVRRNVSADEIAALYASPSLTNFFNIPASEVGSIVDFRLRNFSSTRTDGVDVELGYALALQRGRLDFDLTANRSLAFDNKTAPFTPVRDVLDTPYNPLDMKAVASVVYSLENLAVAAYVNHTDDYTDDRGGTTRRVDSWTTVDLTVRYEAQAQQWLSGLTLTGGVHNLGNSRPPFLFNPDSIPYDGANANPTGRMLFLELAKSW